MSETGHLFPELEKLENESATDPEAHLPGSWLVEVALKVPIESDTFHYRVPTLKREQVQIGQRARVPFGSRKMTGFIVGLPKTTDLPLKKLREIDGILDSEPVFNDEMLSLCRWLARYYACSLAEVLEVALPKSVIREWKKRNEIKLDTVLKLVDGFEEPKRTGRSAKKVIELLKQYPQGAALENILEHTDVSRAVTRNLVKKKLLEVVEPEEIPIPAELETKPELTDEQAAAVSAITSDVDSNEFKVTLLFGITGSGKTEVYLRAIEHNLAQGKGAIVLVPEIALTPQTTRRFKARFGQSIAVLHSALSDRERWTAWQSARKGEAKVVIGPRSALFAPVPNLGLIIVDEEHETTYKQERSPRYQARDVAVLRAKRLNAAVVLGSATPSLESYNNAMTKRYRLVKLTKRAGAGELPPVEIVDMGQEWRTVKAAPLLSRRLVTVVKDCLERGERAILFLNRRGFTTVLMCRHCGYLHKCPYCDVTMTFHKKENKVVCHFCAENSAAPTGPCPECSGPPLKHKGAGTERIEEICQSVFPTAKIERVDSDTVRTGDAIEVRLNRFRRGETDLLIGTQMIARGLDIPEVTAVGIINADTSLSHPDFRATERTFQLIAQVAGRAGRGSLPGRTIVQTFHPQEPSILAAAAHNFEQFAPRELQARSMLGYPPFGRLLHILVRSEKQDRAESNIEELAKFLRENMPEKCRLLGPAVSPRAYLANKFRFQLLIKGPHSKAIQQIIELARDFQPQNGVEVVLDRDPLFMM